MRLSWKIVGGIAGVWILVGLIVMWSRSARATPESVAHYVAEHPIENLSPTRRAEVIDHVAAEINKLDFDQRQELRKARVDRNLFLQMTDEEKRRFLDKTLPEGFRQLMLSLNKMSEAKRQKLVDRALRDIEDGDPGKSEGIAQEDVKKFVSAGMDAFYSEASAEVKLDFAPVIERMQRATQGLR